MNIRIIVKAANELKPFLEDFGVVRTLIEFSNLHVYNKPKSSTIIMIFNDL